MKSLVILNNEDLNKEFNYDIDNTCFVYLVRDSDDWLLIYDFEKRHNVNVNVFNLINVYKSIYEFNAFNKKFKLDTRNIDFDLITKIKKYFESHLCEENCLKEYKF